MCVWPWFPPLIQVRVVWHPSLCCSPTASLPANKVLFSYVQPRARAPVLKPLSPHLPVRGVSRGIRYPSRRRQVRGDAICGSFHPRSLSPRRCLVRVLRRYQSPATKPQRRLLFQPTRTRTHPAQAQPAQLPALPSSPDDDARPAPSSGPDPRRRRPERVRRDGWPREQGQGGRAARLLAEPAYLGSHARRDGGLLPWRFSQPTAPLRLPAQEALLPTSDAPMDTTRPSTAARANLGSTEPT